jgi:importin-4
VPPSSTEQSEWDAALIRDAADLVSAIAQVLGPDFTQAFGTFFSTIQSYYDPQRQTVDRSYAIGVLAEIVNGMKASITPFADSLLQLFVRALRDPELDVRSNAAFAFGSLAYWAETDLSSYYPKFLGDVLPILENPATDSEANQARDNASGAIARLILKNAAAIPMDQVRFCWLRVS